jgi:ATP-dependent DNA helicase RecG
LPGITPDTEVRFLPGVGPRRAAALAEVGIVRAADLLLRLPFRYEDRSRRRPVAELADGDSAATEVLVSSLSIRPTWRRNLRIVELRGHDASGPVKATWFNQVHLKQILKPGQRVLLFGKVKRPFAGAAPEFANPGYELVTEARDGAGGSSVPDGATLTGADAAPPAGGDDAGASGSGAHAGRIVPIYERAGPLTPRLLRTILHRLLAGGDAVGPGHLPEELVKRIGLPSRREALEAVHFPPVDASLRDFERRRSDAHQRLILEEFFVFALGLQMRRRQDRVGRPGGHAFAVDDALRELVRKVLPFRLTSSQRAALATIADEFQSPLAMRRLLQGDVGSGKTIVAVIAALIVMHHRAQVALMAPTEVLAEQHFATIRALLEPHRIRVVLLTAGLGAAERRDTLQAVASGWAQFVVGTHSLIQDGARFRDLGFAIVDEQHRFGVAQRRTLVERGGGADLLVMTATPIPRTLTMALHGDLDLSELRELPPGRQPVSTLVRDASALPEVYSRVCAEVRKGRQAFHVCPLIEDSEELGAGVEARFRELSEGPFRGLRVDFVHGRVPAARREQVMSAFASGELDVLVATTVIEVGVDVPNATVMVVEHAERFGLAQLHQLRGRVGRGSDPAFAMLVVGAKPTEAALRRLQVLEATTDGFRIAEEDLAIRGPGDFLGTRQSGIPPFRVADIVRDAEFLSLARKEASDFLASSAIATDEGQRILDHVRETWGERFGLTAGA